MLGSGRLDSQTLRLTDKLLGELAVGGSFGLAQLGPLQKQGDPGIEICPLVLGQRWLKSTTGG